jgi:glycosyltransferase involved in cell wall biosynthesis
MPNRRIPGRGEGAVDPKYRGKVFVEEDWMGIRTLRSWVFAGASQGFLPKVLNNASFMVSGLFHALIRARRPSVIIASSPPFFPHLTGVVLAKIWGVPLILEIRDLWPDYLVQMGMLRNRVAQRALFAFERWMLGRASHVVVVTESFKARVIDKGIPADRISVIPNGVRLEGYQPSTSRSAPPGLEGVVAPGKFNVGYLGTFGRGQGLVQVIDAARILAERDPDIQIALVGDGPDRPAVAAAVSAAGIRNVVLAPPIPRDQTAGFYNWCEVCLVPLAPIPIFQETIPSKIFEVMACGRPLVASVKGEAGAIVERSQGGLRVDPGNGAQLAEAIETLRRITPADAHDMGARARRYVSEHFDRERLADHYLQLLRRLSGMDSEAAGAG